MTDGLVEILITDSLNEFDVRIKERKMSQQTWNEIGVLLP